MELTGLQGVGLVHNYLFRPDDTINSTIQPNLPCFAPSASIFAMCDNIDVKGCSNLYGEGSKDGVWVCNGCISSMATGEFFVAGGPCCRMPVFGLLTDRLEKGMNSTAEDGTVYKIRKCIGCLITNKPCAAVSPDGSSWVDLG